MQDFEDGIREKSCRPAKLEGFSSRLSALSSEGTSLIAMARGSVGRGPRKDKVNSQGVEDTITSLQHKMEAYKKLERRTSVHLSTNVTTKKKSPVSKRFSMGNFDDYSMLPKLEFIEANPQPAIKRLFPEKKREGIRRGGSLRMERPVAVHKLSSQFERGSVDDSCKPAPPERIDSFKAFRARSQASVNSLRQKFEMLSTDGSPSSSMEDLSTSVPKRTFGDESPSVARRRTPPAEKAKTMPLVSSGGSPSTRRVTSLKIVEERAESPKVSPQAIETILQSLSISTENSSKGVGGAPAGSRLSQHLHQQLPELAESSDDEELNKEMESLAGELRR